MYHGCHCFCVYVRPSLAAISMNVVYVCVCSICKKNPFYLTKLLYGKTQQSHCFLCVSVLFHTVSLLAERGLKWCTAIGYMMHCMVYVRVCIFEYRHLFCILAFLHRFMCFLYRIFWIFHLYPIEYTILTYHAGKSFRKKNGWIKMKRLRSPPPSL